MIPFSNGSEYRAWRSKNCDVCKKDYDWGSADFHVVENPSCSAETELTLGSGPSGEISDKAYKFIGLDKGWDCPHREPE